MAKKKRNKRYKPYGINLTAHEVAIQGASRLSLDDRLAWGVALEGAISAIRTATATEADWSTVFDGVNLVEQLVRMRLAPDTDGLVQAAQDACVAITDRQRATGVRAARATELAVLTDLRASFVRLMDGISHSERLAADKAVQHRVRRALAGAEPAARLVQPLEQEPA
jgi:hypothetical protein